MFFKALGIGRIICLALAFLLVSLTASAADKKSDADSRLETLLQEWKKADHQIRELHYTFQLTTVDRVLRDKETIRGEVFFQKPNLVRIDCKDKKGELYQIWVWKDKTIRVYDLKDQTEVFWPLDQDGSENWLIKKLSSFFRSVPWQYTALFLDETQKSFHFDLNKEDEYWAYIQLNPRNPEEFSEYKEMEAVLNQKTHLARQLRWMTSNGNRMILDFEKIEINPTPLITWESISKDLPKKLKKFSVTDGLSGLFGPTTPPTAAPRSPKRD